MGVNPRTAPLFDPKEVVWDDLTNSLIARRLESGVGTLSYNWPENSITVEPGGTLGDERDTLFFNLQIPHGTLLGVPGISTFRLHFHWWQVSSNRLEWSGQYRFQRNGQDKTTAWTAFNCNSVDNSAFAYPGPNPFNQITMFPWIDISALGISDTVQIQICRTDAVAEDVDLYFVDAHRPIAFGGSRQEYIQ